MRLTLTVNRVDVAIDLPGVSAEVYKEAGVRLDRLLANPHTKNRGAIAAEFLHVLQKCPEANASDLWHHVVYRLYCDILPRHRPQNPSQSWVRASGEALEQVIEAWYGPVLEDYQIKIVSLISGKKKREVLEAMGLAGEVGRSKLDVALFLATKSSREKFGGVHVKASLAERVSDDVPASRALMRRGLLSPLWTLDVKSFPPPHGDLINRGELGSPENPSDKRRYVEEHGDFDNCYSANSRSVPSAGKTTSGKRIYTLNLARQPDQFAADVIAFAKKWISRPR